MNKILLRLIPALIFLSVSLFAFEARACSCGPRPSIYKRYRETPAVFIGKAIASKDVAVKETIRDREYTVSQRVFQFSVTESFKGVKASQVWIDAGRIDSPCFSGFATGESYLVFAYGDSEEKLKTGMCSGTNELSDSADELHYIRALLKGVPESRVYGSVMRYEAVADGATAKARVTPMEGIKILIEGGGKQFEAITDKQGLYRIEKIPDGRYKARPLLPDRYTADFPAEEDFFLGTPDRWFHTYIEPGPTAYLTFRIGWNNQLKGRILDSEGNPVIRAKVAVLLDRSPSPIIISRDAYDHRPEGKFNFGGLTPGRYFLSVDIRAPFIDKTKPTRFYYPNTDALDQAEEIRIGESETLDDREIRLPPEFLVREIEGVVVRPNGEPVADGWIALTSSKDAEVSDETYDTESTDALGRFSVQGFVGAEYWVHASFRRSEKGEPIKVKVEKTNEPLKIVLPFPKRNEP